jgi:hypothetical protein
VHSPAVLISWPAAGREHGVHLATPAGRKFLEEGYIVRNKLWALTIAAVFMLVPRAYAVTCSPTGFMVDSINLTAAFINPSNGAVPAVLDATGCNIGVYYDHSIAFGLIGLSGKEIHGANYYGVVVNADAGNLLVNITNNFIHNIGEVPANGAQHGVGLYLRAYSTFSVSGNVTGNIVYLYQKGGIVANGPGVKLTKLNGNLVYGLGHVPFIAQNGIQIGYGALPFPSEVDGNLVGGNSYIGTPGDGSASAGILVVGGPFYTCPSGPCPYTKTVLIGINSALNAVAPNYLLNNDVGVFSFNVAADGVSPPPTPSNVLIIANVAESDQAYNQAYIAAISALGNTDYIVANDIVPGGGYGPSCSSIIDTSGSLNPQVFLNTPATCTSLPASVVPAQNKPVPVM